MCAKDSQVIYNLGNINDKSNIFMQYNDLYSKLFLIKMNPSKSIYVVGPQEVISLPGKIRGLCHYKLQQNQFSGKD